MNKIIKIKLIKVIFLTISAGLLFWQSGLYKKFFRPSQTAQAVGDLVVDWGVPDDQPLFMILAMIPGDQVSRTVLVQNDASSPRPISIRADKTNESKDLSQALQITIFDNNTPIYGPTNLAEFFTQSSGPQGIPLSLVGSGQSTNYTFDVLFPSSSTNEYQDASVVFDLTIGIAFEIPPECQSINFTKPPIYGTQKRDVLTGTNGNDIIIAFEGNDRINGRNGHDCLIGGPGNDIITGGNGNDVLVGDEGNDRLIGNNGNDYIYAGPGNDQLIGGIGNDVLFGDDGRDRADGGIGRDQCQAETKFRCEY